MSKENFPDDGAFWIFRCQSWQSWADSTRRCDGRWVEKTSHALCYFEKDTNACWFWWRMRTIIVALKYKKSLVNAGKMIKNKVVIRINIVNIMNPVRRGMLTCIFLYEIFFFKNLTSDQKIIWTFLIWKKIKYFVTQY